MTHARIPDFSQPIPSCPASAGFRQDSTANPLPLGQKTASRFHDALNLTGEFVTAALIIAGGIAAYGFLPL